MSILPRSIRNNNPANIRYNNISKWIGLVPADKRKDKSFFEFTEMKYGIRAFLILCRTYRKNYGIRTVSAFISRFAPSSENNTEGYIKFVLDKVKSDKLLFESDYDLLAYYIFIFESGYKYVKVSDIVKVHKDFNIKIVWFQLR